MFDIVVDYPDSLPAVSCGHQRMILQARECMTTMCSTTSCRCVWKWRWGHTAEAALAIQVHDVRSCLVHTGARLQQHFVSRFRAAVNKRLLHAGATVNPLFFHAMLGFA